MDIRNSEEMSLVINTINDLLKLYNSSKSQRVIIRELEEIKTNLSHGITHCKIQYDQQKIGSYEQNIRLKKNDP